MRSGIIAKFYPIALFLLQGFAGSRSQLFLQCRIDLVQVCISVSSLDRNLARTLEPRASTPMARMEAIRALGQAGIPTGVIVAPVIPALNDCDMEKILFSAKEAGATDAWYVLLRLPLEISELFREWLAAHQPLKEKHVMTMIRQMRGGKAYDSAFRTRMKGTGVFADLLEQRFKKACSKAGLNQGRKRLSTEFFRRPPERKAQLSLF